MRHTEPDHPRNLVFKTNLGLTQSRDPHSKDGPILKMLSSPYTVVLMAPSIQSERASKRESLWPGRGPSILLFGQGPFITTRNFSSGAASSKVVCIGTIEYNFKHASPPAAGLQLGDG